MIEEGVSCRSIAFQLKVSPSTISRTWKKFKTTGSVENKFRSGRPTKLKERDRNRIKRLILSNEVSTATDLQRKFFQNISASSVRRVLHNEGLNGRVKRSCTHLKASAIKARKDFAISSCKNPRNWENVIYSDESKFNIFGSDGRQYCWRKPGQELDERNTKKFIKHGGGSIMVWGCITSKGVGKLHKIDGIMNTEVYSQIIRDNLGESVRMNGLDMENCIFQQDNDPKHACAVRRGLFRDLGIQLMDWPSYSPDMNIIENVWSWLESAVRKRNPLPTNKASLWQALQEEWYKMDVEFITKLYESIPRRLLALKLAGGRHTKY